MIKLALLCIIAAYLISLALTPLAKKIAIRFGVMDVPKDARRMHKKPIPRMGGLAIYIAFIVTSLSVCNIDKKLIFTLAGATLIAILGIIDDKFALPALPKLVVQLIAAALPVIGGLRINFLNPFGVAQKGYWFMGWLSIPLTVFWIVGITNAINFADGLDGLADGISTIACASLLATAVLTGASYNSIILLSALIGACLGFLPYNFHPASVFMGDTGSTLLGYMLSVIAVGGMFKTTITISFLIPVIALGLPIFDTAFVIIRRILSGKSPMAPDKTHLHHKLIELGFSQIKTVLIIYFMCAVCGIISVGLATGYNPTMWWTVLVCYILSVFFVRIILTAYHKKELNKKEDVNNG